MSETVAVGVGRQRQQKKPWDLVCHCLLDAVDTVGIAIKVLLYVVPLIPQAGGAAGLKEQSQKHVRDIVFSFSTGLVLRAVIPVLS